MAFINPYIKVNKDGIPRLQPVNVNITTSALTYNLQFRPFLNSNWTGLIIFKLPAFTAPSTAVPVQMLSANNFTIQVFDRAGAVLTTANTTLQKGGIFTAFYENDTVRILI